MSDSRDDALERLLRIVQYFREYLIARDATGGEAFDDRQGTQVGAALTFVRLLAIAAAVPVWQAMGLVGP